MKILFTIIQAFNPNAGGVQRSTYKLGKYFTEQGFDVFYYSLEKDGHLLVENGILYTAPKKGNYHNSINLLDMQSVIADVRPNFVINQAPYEVRDSLLESKEKLGFWLLACSRNTLFMFKSNARLHMQELLPPFLFRLLDHPLGIGLAKLRHWFRHRRELKDIIDIHDRFILLTPYNRKELHHFVGTYKAQKIVSIPNSIPAVNHLLEKKENIIVHVGRLNVRQKRSDLLADFWEYIYEKIPDWKFLIIGDGPYRKKLEQEIKEKQLQRIFLEGYQKPEEYLKRAKIFMMPSAYEGFPNTLLEAQSFGCASFAFDSYAALSWIVNHQKDAILIPPFEIKEMGDLVVDLIKNKPEELSLLSKNALSNARRFTIDKVGEQWEHLFESLNKVCTKS